MSRLDVSRLRNVPLVERVLDGLGMVDRTISLATLRAALDASADCIKIVGSDGRLLFMNANGMCAMEIADFAHIERHDWAALWPRETQDRIRASVAGAMLGQSDRFEAFCPTALGAPRWWNVAVAPISAVDDTVCGVISISRDVTEMVRARESLQAALSQSDDAGLADETEALRERSVARRVLTLVADVARRGRGEAAILAIVERWLAEDGDSRARLQLCQMLEGAAKPAPVGAEVDDVDLAEALRAA